jgi:hypothetical protein
MGCVINDTSRPLYPLERDQLLCRWLGGQVQKISPTSGFDPRTVQPVASRKEITEGNTVIGCSPEVMQRDLSRRICAALDRLHPNVAAEPM